MVYVDMNFVRFYQLPAKAGLLSDGRPIISNLRLLSSPWERKDSAAFGASQGFSGEMQKPEVHPQNVTHPLQKDSFDSSSAPRLGLKCKKVDREVAGMPSGRANSSWDDKIPLSCQKANDRPNRPRLRYPPGTICKIGVLGKPTAGETTGDPIEVDSGDDSFSSDDSGSDTRYEASSVTTPAYAASSGFGSSNKGRMKITMIDSEGVRGPAAAMLNPRECRDSSWLNIDHFPDNHLGVEDSAAEDQCQKMGDVQDKPGSDGQAEHESQEMDYSIDGPESGPWDEDGVAHSEEDIIADPKIEGIEMGGDGENPIVVEDEDFEISQASTSTKATSLESEVGTAQLHGSYPNELSPTHTCPNAQIRTKPPAELCDRATSPDVVLPQHRRRRTILGDDHEAAPIMGGSTQDGEGEHEVINNVGLEQSSMEIRQPPSSRSLPANEKRGGQDNWDGAKGADDQGHWAEEERKKVRVREDKGAETEDNREESPSDGDKMKPLVRSRKKRHLPAAGEKPLLGRRIKRHRFTSPLPSDDKEEFEGGYVLEGKIIADREMTPLLGPHRGRPRKQYLVQS